MSRITRSGVSRAHAVAARIGRMARAALVGTVDRMSDDEAGQAPASRTAADAPLLEVLDRFRRAGWTENHTTTDDGQLRCGNCRTISAPGSVRIDAKHRTEGASDPQDMLYVFGFSCPACASRGVVVAGYGPTASEPDQQLIAALGDNRAAIDPVANTS